MDTGFPGDADGQERTCQCRRCKRHRVSSLGREDRLEEDMTTHSSILAWKTSWTKEPGGLQSIGSQRVRHEQNDLARTHRHTHTHIHMVRGGWNLDVSFVDHHSMLGKQTALTSTG